MPDKLTDNEIVKALDSYKKDIGCAKYGFKDKYLFTVIENSLDLINRLQEENEDLKIDIATLEAKNFVKDKLLAKAETKLEEIDNRLKELVGDNETVL